MRKRGGVALAAVLCGLMVIECRHAPQPAEVPRHLFGPVIGNELIAGRADDDEGRIWLLVGEQTLIAIDVDRGTAERHALAFPGTVACWGLARLRDGSLWTLKARRTLAQISEAGGIVREMPLDTAYFGLFADGDRLVYQPADFHPPAPVLFASALSSHGPRVPWSGLRSRQFNLARASVAALNMVICGVGRRGERPCWFPDEAAVALIDASGSTRRVALPGLAVVSPEVLLTSDNPARPVRDAFVDVGGTIWILSSGTPPDSARDQPGGWILAKYSGGGEPLGVRRLAQSARLILRAEPGRVLLITGAGMVAEVRF
jgi:hypothetical protein